MADNLSDIAEGLVLDWLNPVLTAPTRPTSPLKARLYTIIGSESAAGTEVTGGSYTSQTATFPAHTGGVALNTNLISYTLMPACTVVAVEIYDNSAVRLWWGPLAANKVVNAGDTFTFPIGSLSIAIT